jgi:hypothetical protein
MQTAIDGHSFIIVLLDSRSKKMRLADAKRAQVWMKKANASRPPPVVPDTEPPASQAVALQEEQPS